MTRQLEGSNDTTNQPNANNRPMCANDACEFDLVQCLVKDA